jgi:hypothetical protein
LCNSQDLNVAYNESAQTTKLLTKDEDARRLRLRIILLEGQNDELQERLILGDNRIHSLKRADDELRVQIDCTTEEARRQEHEIKAQERELQNLRVCSNHCSSKFKLMIAG